MVPIGYCYYPAVLYGLHLDHNRFICTVSPAWLKLEDTKLLVRAILIVEGMFGFILPKKSMADHHKPFSTDLKTIIMKYRSATEIATSEDQRYRNISDTEIKMIHITLNNI